MNDRRSSRARGMLALAVLGVLATVALISPVGAALNKNKVKKIVNKTAYSKADADGRFINTGEKAADSELLDGVDSAGFLRPQGLVHIAIGPNEWVDRGPDSATHPPAYFNNRAGFVSSIAVVDQFMGATPAIPIALYGGSLQVVGFEFCYATVDDTTLDAIVLQVISDTTGADGTEVAEFIDETDRTDATCRLYSLSTPFTPIGDHFISLGARVDFTASGRFDVGRTTLVLAATNNAAAPLARRGAVTLAPTGSDSGTGAA